MKFRQAVSKICKSDGRATIGRVYTLSSPPSTDISFFVKKQKWAASLENLLFAFAKKDADQLQGNRAAAQRLCFRYIEKIIPLHSN